MSKKTSPPVNGARGLSSFIALSVWEIAHRWHGVDPNSTDPKALPLEAQDTLRSLCLDLVQQLIPGSTQDGDDFGIASTAPTYKQWHATADALARTRGYEAAVDAYTQEHHQAVVGLERCADHRDFDRDKLDSIYVSAFGIQSYCKHNHLPLPQFWFPGDTAEVMARPRREQLDKVACQAIARALWDEHPNLTIQALIKHPAIQRYGNGAHYTEKTLRNWLSEVDSRPPKAKTGRPPKARMEPEQGD